MKEPFCKVTFRRTLEEVLITIEHCRITSIERLVETLKFAVKELKEKEIKNDDIS